MGEWQYPELSRYELKYPVFNKILCKESGKCDSERGGKTGNSKTPRGQSISDLTKKIK